MGFDFFNFNNDIVKSNDTNNVDINIVIRFYIETSSGTKEPDFEASEKHGNTENVQFISYLTHYDGIVRITSDDIKNDLVLEYDFNKRKVNAIGNKYQLQATKLLDAIYLAESLLLPKKIDKLEVISRQLVQLANVYNGTLSNISKETYLNQVKVVNRGLCTREKRNKYLELLDNIINDPKTTTLNKKWAMQIHNRISNEYNSSIAYREALDIHLVGAEMTPFEYTSMVNELLTEAKSCNIKIDMIDLCKKNNIDFSTGMVNERALFVAVSNELQRIMLESKKHEQDDDILNFMKK